jgi:hypothetical protein
MYKLLQAPYQTKSNCVLRLSDSTVIPFAPDNTDYANFKKEINDKFAQLEDANGNLMTEAQAIAYVKELP